MNEKDKKNLKKAGIGAAILLIVTGTTKAPAIARKKAQERLQKRVDDTLPKPVKRNITVPNVNLTLPQDNSISSILNECEESPMNEKEINEWKSLFSTLGSETMKAQLNISSFNGLLKCDVPLKDLCRVSGNPDAMRGMVISDGTIKQQASFTEVGIENMAPLMAFQCMAAVTSQYYQQVITERLDVIDNKLDRILEFLSAEDKANLKVSYNRIVELSKKNTYDTSDKQMISNCCVCVETTREKYKMLLDGINSEKLKVKYGFTDKKEAENKIQALRDSHYFEYLEMAMEAEILTFIASAISLKIANFLGNEEDAAIYVNRLTLDYWNNYEDKFKMIKHDVIEYLNLEADASIIHKKDINKMKKEQLEQFNAVEASMKQLQKPFNCRVVQYIKRQEDGSLKKYIYKGS